MIRLFRVHQWSKNLLLLLPILCAHEVGNRSLWPRLGLAILFFSLGASGQYVLNDLRDLADDRAHPRKRKRPLAAGEVGVASAWVSGVGLIAASLAGSWWVGSSFLGVAVLYHLLTFAYSLWLKHQAVVDVLVLAVLFTLRVFAGGAATGIQVSPWLLTFALFFFLMLAVLKRFAEMRAREPDTRIRDYRGGDEYLLAALGVPAGYLSVLVVAFYIQQPQTTVLYSQPELLWLLCPILLYWSSRMWLVAHRRLMEKDPLDFALTDPASYVVLMAIGAVAYAAI
jgi:4-hydroxybenzoate polyprenyltransferase